MASDYLNSEIAKHVFGKATYTAPAHLYLVLSTADPLGDGSGLAEPSGGDYAPVETDPADWTESGGVVTNNVEITFATPTGSWGLLTHVALKDAAAAGNLIDSSPLPSPWAVDAGSTPTTFPIGSLIFTVT